MAGALSLTATMLTAGTTPPAAAEPQDPPCRWVISSAASAPAGPASGDTVEQTVIRAYRIAATA